MEWSEKRKRMEFEALPEGCIANILSRTTPLDACRLSLVSKIFRSAAESDTVWDRFLPSDYHSIISQSSPPLPNYPSKKSLYLALSDRPIIIDQGKMVFITLLHLKSLLIINDMLSMDDIDLTIGMNECRAFNWRERVAKRVTCLLPELSPLFGVILQRIGTGQPSLTPGRLLIHSLFPHHLPLFIVVISVILFFF